MNVAKLIVKGDSKNVNVSDIVPRLRQLPQMDIIHVKYGENTFCGTVKRALANHRLTEREHDRIVPNVLVVLGLDPDE